MDPFTEKLLEKTRQRREQLQQKLQSTPSSVTRKRKPLQIDTSQNAVTETAPAGSEKVEEKRRRSWKTASSSDENQVPVGVARHPGVSPTVNLPSPVPATRKGRLQKLAAQINNWEDDLSHPQSAPPSAKKEVAAVSTDDESGGLNAASAARPTKPPRTFQAEEENLSTRRSPRFTKQPSDRKLTDRNVADAFSFGSAPGPAPAVRQAKPVTPATKAATESTKVRNSSDEEPTKKTVADRFTMWEKRTGDALTPLRQAAPLPGGKGTPGPASKAASFQPHTDKASSQTGRPTFQQTQATKFTPRQQQPAAPRSGRARRRSRSETTATPEREFTGATAPWNKEGGAPGSAVRSSSARPAAAASAQKSTPKKEGTSTDDEWSKSQDCAFQKAPMSARKFAWEAKIAEQQNVAEEHNRVMYRTRSATRLEGTPQKQQAESQLRQGQTKAYDPAERARQERQAELLKLQNRFNQKGLLKDSESSPQRSQSTEVKATTNPMAMSTESLEDQEYFTASDSELTSAPAASNPTPGSAASTTLSSSNNATAGSSSEETRSSRKRQVSFKSPTRSAAASLERRQSESPVQSQQSDKKLQRRSSCKIPTLGYASSSSDEEMTPKAKVFPLSPGRRGLERGSSSKLPRLGDESSVDSFDDMRQISGSSIGSSVSSYSYHFVAGGDDAASSRDVVDFLDEAMSDEEPTPAPLPRRSPRGHSSSKLPEVKETGKRQKISSDSPSRLYSVDQYRQTTRSVAQLPRSATEYRNSTSVYDTDDSRMSESSSQQSEPDLERRKRIKDLQALVQKEQNIIVQASNALNQCCKSGSTFAGSTEQVECNRLLLIACQRRQAYLAEIEMIKANPHHCMRRKGKGSLTISDIQLPLKREFVKRIGSAEDDTVHYFLLMVRAGPQVVVTQMVSTHDALMRGTLHFPNLIKLNDIMNDFRYELEVYGMQVCRESSLKQSGKKDKKKSGSSSRGRENPLSSSTVRATNFTHITSLMLTMDNIQNTSFKLSRVPYLSPLHGSINLRLRCTMEANIVFKGFINMFEDVGGFGAWHRRWCVLNNHRLSYWKYPDDEMSREPISQLNLKNCVTEEVGLVSRDKCARPNTIELVIVRNADKAEKSSRNKQVRGHTVHEQHWLGLDTKADRLEWCAKLNEALANVRQWFSDASRPLPAKRTVV